METKEKTSVTINALVNATMEKVWKNWNEPEMVKQWNNASPDWHTPRAENDLREGGEFVYTMAAKDGSFSFDFGGVYITVKEHKLIAYTMGDGRKVSTSFEAKDGGVEVTTTFEAESQNPVDFQRDGWQSILNNFKKFTEEF